MTETTEKGVSRRVFLKASAVSAAAAAFPAAVAWAAGSDRLRVGLIGCGGRGLGAAKDCVRAAKGVEIVALGDLFPDKVTAAMGWLQKQVGDSLKATQATCFSGWDAYQKVLAADVDMVILATPPHFCPRYFAAAVAAGKHVFMEKPVAVDPVGVRAVIAAGAEADAKGLRVVAGTQRRHQQHYIEIMRRIHDGAIGKIVAAQCYWNAGQEIFTSPRRGEGWSDMEYQVRAWYYFTWASGDHIVEQHVHNLDAVSWALQKPPTKILGMGGRQHRTIGNIYDHFAVEYEYDDGVRVSSMCRQVNGADSRVEERIVGTKGVAFLNGGTGRIEGANPYTPPDSPNPYIQEHIDLIAAIRGNAKLNEARTVAESTMMAVCGRMSAYTGRAFNWKWAMERSTLDLSLPKYEFGPLPVDPVAYPGQTKLI